MDELVIINDETLKDIIDKGEDSFIEFKVGRINQESLNQSIVAFLNQQGGRIIFGVNDKKNIIGIDEKEVKSIEAIILNSRNQITPTPSITAYNYSIDNKHILILEIPKSENKPYSTNDGRYFIRFGASKRIMSQEELQRSFQTSRKIYAEEMIIQDSSFNDINLKLFEDFYKKKFNEEIDLSNKEWLQTKLNNIKCLSGEHLTLLGAILFCDKPQKFLHTFSIKAVAIDGLDKSSNLFRSKKNIDGNLRKMYEDAKDFILTNLPKQQVEHGFNTIGKIPISQEALGEILVNALIHRDYFINSPIDIFIFDDRVEIKSPGTLPNSLTIDDIKNGAAIPKNSILSKYAEAILPYTGMGTGINRALKEDPNIDFINNTNGAGEFTAIIPLEQDIFKKQTKKNNKLIFSNLQKEITIFIGNFNYLKNKIIKENPQLGNDLNEISIKINELELIKNETQMIKSGILYEIRDLIEDLNNENSNFGKTLKWINKGDEIIKELKDSYNKITEWIGFPQIPKIF